MTVKSSERLARVNLAVQFREAARRACPEWSDKQIAEYVGESRQNFAKAISGSVSTDRVQTWIRRWNGDGPRPPRLFLLVESGGVDLTVGVEPPKAGEAS